MSLNAEQRRRTSEELQENLRLAGVDADRVCTDLGISPEQLEAALNVTGGADPADVWRLRDYLNERVEEAGLQPREYSSLTEDMRSSAQRWFGIG